MATVVVSVEFQTDEPEADSVLILDMLKQGMHKWPGSEHFRYKTTHPED